MVLLAVVRIAGRGGDGYAATGVEYPFDDGFARLEQLHNIIQHTVDNLFMKCAVVTECKEI